MRALRAFTGIHPIHHFQGALFALHTDGNTVHMYEEEPGYGGEACAVVEVDPSCSCSYGAGRAAAIRRWRT